MSDVANSTNQIQFCLFASGGKISAPATRSLFTFPMDSTLNFPPLTGTHDATRKASLPGAVYLVIIVLKDLHAELPGWIFPITSMTRFGTYENMMCCMLYQTIPMSRDLII